MLGETGALWKILINNPTSILQVTNKVFISYHESVRKVCIRMDQRNIISLIMKASWPMDPSNPCQWLLSRTNPRRTLQSSPTHQQRPHQPPAAASVPSLATPICHWPRTQWRKAHPSLNSWIIWLNTDKRNRTVMMGTLRLVFLLEKINHHSFMLI